LSTFRDALAPERLYVGQTRRWMTPAKLDQEAERATALLRGRAVKRVWRHSVGEVGIEFEDGARLFVRHLDEGNELSITGCDDQEESETSG
jgi:hypothetical protein